MTDSDTEVQRRIDKEVAASQERLKVAMEMQEKGAKQRRLDYLAGQAPAIIPDWYIAPPMVDDMPDHTPRERYQSQMAHEYFSWRTFWAVNTMNANNTVEL